MHRSLRISLEMMSQTGSQELHSSPQKHALLLPSSAITELGRIDEEQDEFQAKIEARSASIYVVCHSVSLSLCL
jgi:hypothetical protein